eukprot:12335982-Alexandrium_andersonii.AAC.1
MVSPSCRAPEIPWYPSSRRKRTPRRRPCTSRPTLSPIGRCAAVSPPPRRAEACSSGLEPAAVV